MIPGIADQNDDSIFTATVIVIIVIVRPAEIDLGGLDTVSKQA
jgi:hypothetical protein